MHWRVKAANRFKVLRAAEGPKFVEVGCGCYSVMPKQPASISFLPDTARLLEDYDEGRVSLQVVQRHLMGNGAAIGCLYYLAMCKKETDKW